MNSLNPCRAGLLTAALAAALVAGHTPARAATAEAPAPAAAQPGTDAKDSQEPAARKAAIFVANRAGKNFNSKVRVLEDFITSRVSDLGFRIISREIVLDAISRYEKSDEKSGKSKRDSGEDLDQLLSENTSALRLAQNLGADLILSVSISSYGTEKKTFRDKENDFATENVVNNLRVSYKLVEAWGGGSFSGDAIKVSKATRYTENLNTASDDVINELLDDASTKIVEQIGSRQGLIKQVASEKKNMVHVTIVPHMTDLANLPVSVPAIQTDADGKAVVRGQNTDVQPLNVNVELDGFSIGSAPGDFTAPPGLHRLRLSREGFKDWSRMVNFYDRQLLEVALQMTEAGYQRWKENVKFLQDLEKERKLTDAEVKVLEGKAKMLSQMGFKVDVTATSLPGQSINVIK